MADTSKDPHAALDAISKEMHALIDTSNATSRRLGELYNRLVKEQLAQKAGYKTTLEYLEHEFGDSVSQASLSVCGAVAAQFSEPVCLRFGIWKLDGLLTYASAAKLPPLPVDPAPVPVKVPKAEGSDPEEKPFAKCSLRNLKAAIHAIREDAPPPTKLPGPDEYRVQALQSAVLTAFGEERTPQVKAHLVRRETLLNFVDVPLSQVETFLAAIDQGLQARPEQPASLAARTRKTRRTQVAAKQSQKARSANRRDDRR